MTQIKSKFLQLRSYKFDSNCSRSPDLHFQSDRFQRYSISKIKFDSIFLLWTKYTVIKICFPLFIFFFVMKIRIWKNIKLKYWSQSSNRSVSIFSVSKAVSPSLLKCVYKSNSITRGRRASRKGNAWMNSVFSRWPGNDSRNCIKRLTQRRNKIALSTFPTPRIPSIYSTFFKQF